MQVAIEHFCPEGLIKCSPVSPRAVTDLTHDWQSCVIYLGFGVLEQNFKNTRIPVNICLVSNTTASKGLSII